VEAGAGEVEAEVEFVVIVVAVALVAVLVVGVVVAGAVVFGVVVACVSCITGTSFLGPVGTVVVRLVLTERSGAVIVGEVAPSFVAGACSLACSPQNAAMHGTASHKNPARFEMENSSR